MVANKKEFIKRILAISFFVLIFIGLMSAGPRGGRADVVDVAWPVNTRPTETVLLEKIATIETLVGELEAQQLDASYIRSVLVTARDFVRYARDDEKNGKPGRAAYVRSYLDEALDASAADARALLADPARNRPVPAPPFRDITIHDGAFRAGGAPVMFGGMGHFGQVRADIPKFPDYGFNLIQIEIGPSSVVTGPDDADIRTDAILNDIIPTLDRAAENNVMVNLLLSPHYFPDWAMKKYPELAKCGRGFIKYCVSDPDARRVLQRFLEVLIPLIKDKPALQSYTLANEPIFSEMGDQTIARFREELRQKYGNIKALNKAWGKKYKSFDSFKITEDFINLTPAARLDWAAFHNRAGTEFFAWMKSVIRTMDPDTPVHIKFMDNMFDHFEALWGIDREALGEVTEISGNDSSISYPGTDGYAFNHRQNAAFFDFLKSMQPDKPIQNSENHIIRDDSPIFYPSEYIRAALMIQYLHGMGASTIWVWERNDGYQLGNNIMSRPNCAQAAARATLDVRRLAPQVYALANARPRFAIYYSQTARVLQRDFNEKWAVAYEQALYQGLPVGFVTDRMIEAGLSPEKTPLLYVPEYVYISGDLYKKLMDYVRRGGHVVAVGSLFRFNQKTRKRDTAAWDALECGRAGGDNKGCVYSIHSLSGMKKPAREDAANVLRGYIAAHALDGAPGLTVTDKNGRRLLGVEYRYTTYGGRRIAYILNVLDSPVELKLQDAHGTWNTVTDLIEGVPVTGALTLQPMQIVMFEY